MSVPRPPSNVWTSKERTEILRRDADRSAVASKGLTQALVSAARLDPGLSVLDLACGAGDPAIEIARAIGPTGKVVGADLSEGALEVARERAARAGYANLTFQTADAGALPFPSRSFDRAVCRFGAMFFEDIERASREIARVLRPSGRVALMVWGPWRQPNFECTTGVVLGRLGLSELPPEFSTPFRFAEPGPLEAALQHAGFEEVRERTEVVDWVWAGTPEQMRDSWRESAVYFRPLIDRLPAESSPAVWDEVATRFRAYYDGKVIRIPDVVRVVAGHL